MHGLPLQALRVLIMAALVVGGGSLARLDADYAHLGALGEFRFAFVISAAALAGLYALASRHLWHASRATLLWLLAFVALHAAVAASWLWSDRTVFSDTQAYEIFLLVSTVLLCSYLFYGDPQRTAVAFFAVLYAFGCALVAASLLLSGGLQGEVAQLGAGGIGTSRMQGLAVISALYFAMRSGRVRWLIPVPLMLAAMLASGSRAAVFALVPALAFLAWRRERPVVARRRSVKHWITIAIMFLLPAIFFATPIGRPILLAFVVGNFVAGTESGSSLYLADRDVIFVHALQAAAERPWLGHGIGTYLGPFGELYPHNMLLGYAVDVGVPVLLACCALIGWACYRLLLARFAMAGVVGAAAVFYLAASQFAGTYYDARFAWIFMLLVLALSDSARVTSRLADLGARPGVLVYDR